MPRKLKILYKRNKKNKRNTKKGYYMGSITRNFSPSEVACKCGKCKGHSRISQDLMLSLQTMRDSLGPLYINSGVRCSRHPESISRPTSSHIPKDIDDLQGKCGHAVDVKVENSRHKFKIIDAALKAGIRRIGVGTNFVHIDNDITKPQAVMWTY